MGQEVCGISRGYEHSLEYSLKEPTKELESENIENSTSRIFDENFSENQHFDLEHIEEKEEELPSNKLANSSIFKTRVHASWNLLESATTSKFDIMDSFKSEIEIENILENFMKNHFDFDKVKNIENQENQDPTPSINPDFFKKISELIEHQSSLRKAFEKAEIKIENFIKIRNENIEQYYVFKEALGEGASGCVFRGIEKETGDIRAIKVLKEKVMKNVTKVSLISEMEILKKLDHPNIVKLFDLFFHEGRYYIVTELCEGGQLEAVLEQHKHEITHEMIQAIMKQLLSVLCYLNSLEIVHRDLKLENIVLLRKFKPGRIENLEIKIIDFGSAVKLSKQEKNKTRLVGTLLYMPPEIFKGFITQKFDVWSAGIILYVLLMKKYPFKGKTKIETIQNIRYFPLNWAEVNRAVPKEALEVLKGMLDRSYETRMSCDEIIKSPWLENFTFTKLDQTDKERIKQRFLQYNRKSDSLITLVESYLSTKKISQFERQQISKSFYEIDQNSNGSIETNELISFFEKNYPEIEKKEILNVLGNIDRNKSEKIGFTEYITIMREKPDYYASETLKEAFELIDSDKTGYIDKRELRFLLKKVGKKEIDLIMKELDKDMDGKISWKEFENYFKKKGRCEEEISRKL